MSWFTTVGWFSVERDESVRGVNVYYRCPSDQSKARRDTVRKLRELVKKAEKGDKKVLPETREILEERTELAWQFRNLAGLAERFFIDKMSKDKDLAAKEVMERQLAAMREEIAGENPSTLERLLAERVVATWLQIQLFEGLYASSMFKGGTISQGNYEQKRLDQTYRRRCTACYRRPWIKRSPMA